MLTIIINNIHISTLSTAYDFKNYNSIAVCISLFL